MPSDSSSTSSSSQSSATSTYTMATGIYLPTFPEFELQPRDTTPTRFEKYVKRLNNMFTAMNITRAPQKEGNAATLCRRSKPAISSKLLLYRNRPKEMMYAKLQSKRLPITLNLRSGLITTSTSFVRKPKSPGKTLPNSTHVFSYWHANVNSPIPSWR